MPLRLPLLTPLLLALTTLMAARAEAPETIIDRAGAARHADLLTPGQQALLAALPTTFRLPVHATTRTEPAPAGPAARLDEAGAILGLGPGLPFPNLEAGDPEAGLKAIWNHRLRRRGSALERSTVQAVVHADRPLEAIAVRERLASPSAPDRPLLQHLTALAAPPRLAGSIKLLHEPLAGATLGWQRSPGPALPSLKPTTDAGGDTPVIGTDGLLAEDQLDGFRGDPARWRWRLVERGMRVVPWQADAFAARDGALAGLLGPRHADPDRLRYERREVLQVDARLQPGHASPWPQRRYYLDAATWQVLLVELHDAQGNLQRLQEVHVRRFGTQWLPAVTVVHDLPGRRYLVTGIDLGADATTLAELPDDAFAPASAPRWAKSVGAAPPRR